MTPLEALGLMEAHRELWPEWVAWVAVDTWGTLSFGLSTTASAVGVEIGKPRGWGVPAKVRHGLSDDENVRRILAAAQKGYDRRQRQLKARQGKPMKRGKGPARGARLKPNRERKAARFEEDFGGKERVGWGKARPCDTCHAPPPSQNSHVLSRNGRLGKAREQISQCEACHEKVYMMDTSTLLKIAERVYQEWLDQGGYELPSGLERHGEAR